MQLLDLIPDWITTVTLFIVGIIALWGVVDKVLRDRNKEKTSLEDKIRELYKAESQQLQAQVTKLSDQVKKLSTENEIITKIFQGRDEGTKEFQRQGFEAIKTSAKILEKVEITHKIAVENHDGLMKMATSIENLVKIMEKHLQNDKTSSSKVSIPTGTKLTVEKS